MSDRIVKTELLRDGRVIETRFKDHFEPFDIAATMREIGQEHNYRVQHYMLDGTVTASRLMTVPVEDSLLFQYRAGDDYVVMDGTFTRPTTAGAFNGSNVRLVKTNQLRDLHYIKNPVTGLYERSTLLEGQRTNGVTETRGPWPWTTRVQVTAPISSETDPEGKTTAVRLVTDAGGITTNNTSGPRAATIAQTTLSNTFSGFVYLKAAEFDRARVRLSMNTAVGTGGANTACVVDLTNGDIIATNQANDVGDPGTWRTEMLPSGWVKVSVDGLVFNGPGAGNAANENGELETPTLMVFPQDSSGAAADGNSGILAWGPQIEAELFGSSLIHTQGAPATRTADNLTFDWPHEPQPMTVYCRISERGSALTHTRQVWSIGHPNHYHWIPALQIISWTGSSQYRARFRVEGTDMIITSAGFETIQIGDIVELLVSIWKDENTTHLRFEQSINSNSSDIITTSEQFEWPSEWNAPFLRLTRGLGFNSYTHFRIDKGTHSLEQMRRAAGVPS